MEVIIRNVTLPRDPSPIVDSSDGMSYSLSFSNGEQVWLVFKILISEGLEYSIAYGGEVMVSCGNKSICSMEFWGCVEVRVRYELLRLY